MYQLRVVLLAFGGLFKAWRYLCKGQLAKVRTPELRTGGRLSNEEIARTVNLLDQVVKRIIVRSKHVCFYRAYVRALVLRRLGLPLVMNIGLRDFNSDSPVDGHCWLTLNGDKFYEPMATEILYPVSLGAGPGHIEFWVKPGKDREGARRKAYR